MAGVAGAGMKIEGKHLTPEEFEVFKGRPGDRVQGGSGTTAFARLINDLGARQGKQRVLDLRNKKSSGEAKSRKAPLTNAGGEPKLTKKAVRRTKPTVAPGRKVDRPVVSRGAKAKSILKNTSNKDTLG